MSLNNVYKFNDIAVYMEVLFQIILASIIVSLISLSGIVFFFFREKSISRYTILLVALAAGTLLGTAFFHLIPEAVELHFENIHLEEEVNSGEVHIEEEHDHLFLPSYFILLGILFLYLVEKFVRWHHHHDINCEKHEVSTSILIGDGLHNVIDGVLIAVAFMADYKIGIATTIAIALHEIPQEIGDYSILIHSGFSKLKALLWNFISASSAIFGAVLAFFFLNKVEMFLPLFISFVAGNFIYIALADVIPEISKKRNGFSQLTLTLIMLVGIGISFLSSMIGH